MDPLDDSDPDVSSPAAASVYSSCDGSERDRYCSANSALGSSSVCSSIGNHNELLESLKSSSRWNGFDGVLDCGGGESPRGNGQDSILMDGVSPLGRIRNGSRLVRASVMKNAEGEELGFDYGGPQDEIINCGISSLRRIRSGSKLLANLGKGKSTDDGGLNEEEIDYSDNSSCIGSDGEEDSSIEYGLGEEGRIRFIPRNGLQCRKENGNESGNTLIMNSSVAFGANDWDEFEQEGAGGGLGSLSLCDDQLLLQQPSIVQIDASSVIEKECDESCRSKEYEVLSLQKHNSEENSRVGCVKFDPAGIGREAPCASNEGVSGCDVGEASTQLAADESELTITPLCNNIFKQSFEALNRAFERKDNGDEDDGISSLLSSVRIGQNLALKSIVIGNYDPKNVIGADVLLDEAKNPHTFDSYDEMVHEMEEILLDSGNSPGGRSTQNGGYTTQQHSHHIRDGSSTASTSGTDDVYPPRQHPSNINRIEVVGAKQKKGDVSFGERLVGVKEYTVYKLKVWSGKDQWEVERRYRDFLALYHQLQSLFTDHGLSLPYPWLRVERESRKIFGNASPDVISERSNLIQDCLQSILNLEHPPGIPSSLVRFLSPGQIISNSSLLKSFVPQSLLSLGKDQNSKLSLSSKDISKLGKTISLVVELKPRKSMRQLLEAQNYKCAGCHSQLDAGKTLLREIVQTLGWKKARFCEYTSQLFCVLCHTSDTAVLPARVLHQWDFALYPVSQLAKAYLDSIYDQPMLCVSAVNPFLFSKVPALLHVMGMRKKIGAMLPYVRCPFRKAVQRSLGIRRYLLESNDFFALRDLVDLSKGAFAALPIMVETVSNKILEHITEQCLVCYDSGIPCVARQDCDDPASLIFPFQEAEAAKCSSCGSIFHKPCFVKLMGCCPCSRSAGGSGPMNFDGVSDRSNRLESDSSSPSGLLSEILSKATSDKIWRPKNSNPVILMGSLPSTSL